MIGYRTNYYFIHISETMNSCILTPSEERRQKAFWKALHSDTARTQLQWHVSVCMTAVDQSEARVVSPATNERPGMPLMTHRTLAQLSITPVHLLKGRRRGGDVYLLWHLCPRDRDLRGEMCSRLLPVGVSELLILINRNTAEGLGVGFHSLNQ